MNPTTKDQRPLCAGKHVLFDSTDAEDHALACQFCATCPVLAECRQLTQNLLNEGHPIEGTWAARMIGKMTFRTVRRVTRRPAECGTDGGYFRHVRTLKESACAACKDAHRMAERRRVAEQKERVA